MQKSRASTMVLDAYKGLDDVYRIRTLREQQIIDDILRQKRYKTMYEQMMDILNTGTFTIGIDPASGPDWTCVNSTWKPEE